MPALTALGSGGTLSRDDFSLVTVTHATMGEPAFGIAPGKAEIWATLRTMSDRRMGELVARAEALVRETATARRPRPFHLLSRRLRRLRERRRRRWRHLRQALDAEGVPHEPGEPLRASEDFGRFGAVGKSAMFFLGAGEVIPRLHNPDYDFPDDLIPIGARVFMRAARDLLG